MPEAKFEFSKTSLDEMLKELAKEYRKIAGKGVHAEMILVGGASVLLNYGFRNSTTDIDAFIYAASTMKEAINIVGERHGLPEGWINDDFKKTLSYTPKIIQYSSYYRTYSNVLEIRTVASEYLIAMKLRSGRQYKSDLSDVLGILAAHESKRKTITIEMIKRAAEELYGDWNEIPESSRNFIDNVMRNGSFHDQYARISEAEKATRSMMIQFEKDYPGRLKTGNAEGVIDQLQKKSDKAAVLELLRRKK